MKNAMWKQVAQVVLVVAGLMGLAAAAGAPSEFHRVSVQVSR
jgi:hypothetical protein